MEWQTKTICKFIGMQAQVDPSDHGGRNPIMDAADDIHIERTPEDEKRARELDEVRGPEIPTRGRAVIKDDGEVVEETIPAGTFEALMGGLGPPLPMPEGVTPDG